MINWSKFTFPPINLWSLAKMTKDYKTDDDLNFETNDVFLIEDEEDSTLIEADTLDYLSSNFHWREEKDLDQLHELDSDSIKKTNFEKEVGKQKLEIILMMPTKCCYCNLTQIVQNSNVNIS